ncbi:MAG: fimbrillin family protein [Bacteroides sp.]|nr:fimbrillin family protein [Bacteroides sp.]
MGSNPIPLTIRATAEDFGNLPQAEAPLTRVPTEDGNTTVFRTGDAIGIFALKDGAIVDGINNTKLTYNNASGTDSWETPTGTALYYYEGVSYIAYYPYKDNIAIDATQGTDAIIASLLDNSDLQPATDQSNTDGSGYTGSDLMTAFGTPPAGSTASEKILTLEFNISFSLLVLVPRVFVQCTAPANGGFVYRSGAKLLLWIPMQIPSP